MKRSYPAVRIRQTPESADLVLFAAPASDIDDWAGIPQRERLGSDETVGFQREENVKRLEDLKAFYGNPENIIQNPLLCASRVGTPVTFNADANEDDSIVAGKLEIEWEDLRSLSLVEVLERLQTSLEARMPDLAGRPASDAALSRLRQRANADHPEMVDQLDEVDEIEAPEELDDAGEGETAEAALFTDETHIADFWEEVAGRAQLLRELGTGAESKNFLGFSKEAMIAYLQPVVVVDGQHRLRGALLAADEAVNADAQQAEIEAAIEGGEEADAVAELIRRREARLLPVSLLLETSPAEHVFQFVVVNQKATPIGRALLGTIVSTSLTAEELSGVSDRLTAAGIPLEDSQAIAYLTRHPDSPFKDLVEKGLSDDSSDLMQWNVLGSLVRIFRELKGGKLFHERLDYADKWRRDQLDSSGFVSDGADTQERMKLWSASDGPWREVFMVFFRALRDRLGTTEESDTGDYWGGPRKSNLFNKISLTILTADFFQFLCERGYGLDSVDDVTGFVDEWLTDVSTTYFSRDWQLSGVKKDATGTRAQWSYLWVQYRKDPQRLPSRGEFRKPRNV